MYYVQITECFLISNTFLHPIYFNNKYISCITQTIRLTFCCRILQLMVKLVTIFFCSKALFH